jgi:YidC/Oxa1 family membrane protein insertase
MRYLILVVAGFCLLCGWLVVESGLFDHSSRTEHRIILLQNAAGNQGTETQNAPESDIQQFEAADSITTSEDNTPSKSITLGSADPKSGYKFQLELSPKGAAIRRAIFSEFNDRDHKNPQPLVIISPIQDEDGSEILSMANTGFQNESLHQQKRELPLDKFIWKSIDKVIEDDSQTARFEAFFYPEDVNDQIYKITKTYTIIRDSYLFHCDITIENLSSDEQKVYLKLTGPGGLGREAFRSDMRSIVAGFVNSQGQIAGLMRNKRDILKIEENINRAKEDVARATTKEDIDKAKENLDGAKDKKQLWQPGGDFLWAAAVNKYFAAIVVPLPDDGKNYCDWITGKTGRLYNPDRDSKSNSGDEMLGVDLAVDPITLAARDQENDSKTYSFQFYLGPKDKSLFDKNKRYSELGFIQTISFMPCFCCPTWIIHPLAFGILALMKWMHAFIPNYGVVIIILVFLMRLIMHPITKKSQVSMSKMGTLAPKVEEIKKKYANNKAEMNKQMMALYREHGASPIMGMLPMMVQMPIWIALWSAVYASIDLRGAAFLPFWITDLSIPDAAWTFPRVLVVPLLNWKIQSLNLLPILMGVAFYLQQKLMPSQANATTNPQMAQQQKMMKIMLPVMFPLMLYNGPSGVNLYIMSSTFAGVIEQHVIRKHIREKEEDESKGLVAATSKTGGKVKKKKPKPFFRNM